MNKKSLLEILKLNYPTESNLSKPKKKKFDVKGFVKAAKKAEKIFDEEEKQRRERIY